ncbi:putative vicilin-like antimicrobial peptides 2-2-like [Capsicum annuum]|nr:putative vicilin-like antimicrobial peptides 2-2-like [Capsicum annuum]
MKKVMRFGKKGKLSPRNVGPYQIVRRIGEVVYELELPISLGYVHPVFHISMLKKCMGDYSLVLPVEEIKVTDSLSYEEEPIEILDHQVRRLRNKEIALVKIHPKWTLDEGVMVNSSPNRKTPSFLSLAHHGEGLNDDVQFPVRLCDGGILYYAGLVSCGISESETPILAVYLGWGLPRRVNGGFHIARPSTSVVANESKARMKRGTPLGSKDRNPITRKINGQDITTKESHMEVQDVNNFDTPEGTNESEPQENEELFINTRFSQRPGVDYKEAYSPVMDGITLCYLISFTVHERIEMHLMDMVTTYLYRSLDNEIYMKIPKGYKMHEASREMYSIKLQRSLYGLKQSRCIWYNRLSKYLSKDGYTNNEIFPCAFIKKTTSEFVVLYVDDINLIETPIELQKEIDYLKKEFEMKDLGRTRLCLGLEIEHLMNGIFVHQSTYIEKVLKVFYMDGVHHLSTPMVVRSLNVTKDSFQPQEKNEEILVLKYHILVQSVSINLPIQKRYLFDLHKAQSQTGYVFICGGTVISWRSPKLSIVATSSNHAEIIVIHEASHESCIAQLKGGFIKGDRTKRISPKLFYTHVLQKNGDVDVRQGLRVYTIWRGRRIFPGMPLAIRMVNLMLASIMQPFNWKLQKGMTPENLDMEEQFEVITLRKAIPVVAVPSYSEDTETRLSETAMVFGVMGKDPNTLKGFRNSELKVGNPNFCLWHDAPTLQWPTGNFQLGPEKSPRCRDVTVSLWNAILSISVMRHYCGGSQKIAKYEMGLFCDAP